MLIKAKIGKMWAVLGNVNARLSKAGWLEYLQSDERNWELIEWNLTEEAAAEIIEEDEA